MKFTCPNCGQKIEATEAEAARPQVCPVCTAAIAEPRATRIPPPAPEAPAPSGRRESIVALLVAMVLIVCALHFRANLKAAYRAFMAPLPSATAHLQLPPPPAGRPPMPSPPVTMTGAHQP